MLIYITLNSQISIIKKVDITDAAQVFSSMSAHMNVDELRENAEPLKYDAVVHFAAIPRILMAKTIIAFIN